MSEPVQLFVPPRAWGIPNPSPFCVKVETWLRMAEVDYVPRLGNPMKAPRGKVPWIEHEGRAIADSQAIVAYLSERFGDLDAPLTPDQRHLSHLVRRTLEEATYFVTYHDRWLIPTNFAHVYPVFFGPYGVGGWIASKVVLRNVRRNLQGHGVARYSAEERTSAALADLDAVSHVLGGRSVFFGDRPTTVDAVVFGFLCQLLWTPFDGPVQRRVREDRTLVRYAEGLRERYWAEIPPLS